MPLALELEPEHEAEYERVRADRKPPAEPTALPPRRYDRFVEPLVPRSTLAKLRANPMAANDVKPDFIPTADERARASNDRIAEFLEAVKAAYAPAEAVSIRDAARVAGVEKAKAQYWIAKLKIQGKWPFAAGVSGRNSSSGSPRVSSKPPPPTPAVAPPTPVIAPQIAPAGPVVAPAGPVNHDLAGMPARLREAADLIERAMDLIGMKGDRS